MNDTENQKESLRVSILFFVMSFISLLLIACPPFFFGAVIWQEHLKFLLFNSPFIILFFLSLVLMNRFFKKSDYGSYRIFKWWIPEVIFLAILLVMAFFIFPKGLIFYLLAWTNFADAIGGLMILLINGIILCGLGAKKASYK